jgi:Tol biopolymer transport system component
LAWVIGDCGAGECQYSIGVFDLDAKTAQFSHRYVPVGMGGQPPAPVWSPDGRWLAYVAWAENPDEAGLWVFWADGQQTGEQALATGRSRTAPSPIWSPDGSWLVFSSTPDMAGAGLWLAEAGTWDLQPLALPADAIPVGWIDRSGATE